jgi:hypothetical protein
MWWSMDGGMMIILWRGVRLMGSLKAHSIMIGPVIRNPAPTPGAAPFHSEIHDDMLRFIMK